MAKSVEKPDTHTTDSAPSLKGTATLPPTSTRRDGVLERYFTHLGGDPMGELDWDQRSAVISGEDGRVVFEQREVEGPSGWPQTATNVVVSKYFRGPLGSPKRETSVLQLIGRGVRSISGWGETHRYCADDAQRH